MQPHHDVELVLLDHLHLDASQQFAQHQALGYALALAERCQQIVDLLPVLPHRALFVAPELGSRVERCPVDERLREPARLPVRGAPLEVLRDVKTELPLGGQCLDGPDVEPAWRRDAPLRHAQHVVDRRERSRSEPLARRELGRLDRGGKFGEDRLSLVVQPIQQIGKKIGTSSASARV